VTREQAPGPGQRQRPEVLETAAEQDKTVQGLAEAELADLEAQPTDPDEDVATDSIDEDYQPIPRYRSPILSLTTIRPVVQAQPPAQTQPWWLYLRG
jgi:hypothetical protein